MPEIVDQYSDPGFRMLYRLINDHPQAEEHIKQASLDPEENEKVADTAFAWREKRMFRIDSPSQTALSHLYMTKQADVPQEARDLCARAMKIYGIEMPLQEKVAAVRDDSDDYLLPEIKRFKVQSREDVKLAAEAIVTNIRKMDVNSRARAAINLFQKAAEFNVDVPEQIYKLAGMTMCNTHTLRDWLEARASRTTDATIHFGFSKLAEEVTEMPLYADNRAELIKLAAAIAELDKAAELDRLYDRKLPDPLQTVFNCRKLADEMVDLAGHQVPMESLLSVSPDVYADVFGPDLAAEFTDATGGIDPEKFKVILPTIPYDLQKVLVSQLGV